MDQLVRRQQQELLWFFMKNHLPDIPPDINTDLLPEYLDQTEVLTSYKTLCTQVKELISQSKRHYDKILSLLEVYIVNCLELSDQIPKTVIQENKLATLQDCRAQLEQFRENQHKLLVLGDLSCGKSSFINSLLACPVLPVIYGRNTVVITEVYFSPTPALFVTPANGETEFQVKEFSTANCSYILSEYTLSRLDGKETPYSLVKVGWPASILENFNFTIIDTPAINSKPNEFKLKALIEYAKSCVGFIWIVNASVSEWFRKLVQNLSESFDFGAIERDRKNSHLFVINKSDLFKPSDRIEVEASIKRFIKEQIGPGIDCCFLSAEEALKYCSNGIPSTTDQMQFINQFFLGNFPAYIAGSYQQKLQLLVRKLVRIIYHCREYLDIDTNLSGETMEYIDDMFQYCNSRVEASKQKFFEFARPIVEDNYKYLDKFLNTHPDRGIIDQITEEVAQAIASSNITTREAWKFVIAKEVQVGIQTFYRWMECYHPKRGVGQLYANLSKGCEHMFFTERNYVLELQSLLAYRSPQIGLLNKFEFLTSGVLTVGGIISVAMSPVLAVASYGTTGSFFVAVPALIPAFIGVVAMSIGISKIVNSSEMKKWNSLLEHEDRVSYLTPTVKETLIEALHPKSHHIDDLLSQYWEEINTWPAELKELQPKLGWKPVSKSICTSENCRFIDYATINLNMIHTLYIGSFSNSISRPHLTFNIAKTVLSGPFETIVPGQFKNQKVWVKLYSLMNGSPWIDLRTTEDYATIADRMCIFHMERKKLERIGEHPNIINTRGWFFWTTEERETNPLMSKVCFGVVMQREIPIRLPIENVPQNLLDRQSMFYKQLNDIIQGVIALHKQSIVHILSLKNIVISRDDQSVLKIMDFLPNDTGIFLAPEIRTPKKKRCGQKAVVYAFGVLAYCLWNNVSPKLLNERMRFNSGLPQPILDKLVMCLDTIPAERPSLLDLASLFDVEILN